MNDNDKDLNVKGKNENSAGDQPREEKVQAIKTTEFMKETIKQRPLNKKKLMRRLILTISMAVIFGLVACLTFIILEPLMMGKISTGKTEEEEVKTVTFVEETVEEETNPQDMIAEESELVTGTAEQQIVLDEQQIEQLLSNVKFDVDDYVKLNNSVRNKMSDISGSFVGVIGISEGTDWFDDRYESTNEISGVIIAENGRDYLILADVDSLGEVDSLKVEFFDGNSCDAEVVMKDRITGLGIISVMMNHMRVETRERISIIEMGSSAYKSLNGIPVVAMGRPLGDVNSMNIGYITSSSSVIDLPDSYYTKITTNMFGSVNATGALVNFKGQLIGIIKQDYNSEESSNLISAIGISELRRIIELMSNGKEIPYIGVYGTDITAGISEEMGIPQGALIREIEIDSPFLEAGIQSGDVIIKFAGINVSSFQDVVNLMLTMQIENKVAVEVMRQGPDGYTPIANEVVLAHQFATE